MSSFVWLCEMQVGSFVGTGGVNITFAVRLAGTGVITPRIFTVTESLVNFTELSVSLSVAPFAPTLCDVALQPEVCQVCRISLDVKLSVVLVLYRR